MGIEFVDIVQLFTAYIALPWIALTMATLMQKIECLIGKFDATKQTLQHPFATMTARYSSQQ